jgi:acetylornithine deacetylase/succinyl-diaminopimelate desuccinylase-like protein
MAADGLTSQTVDLLQALIRNECVNDGNAESGNEVRSAELLEGFLEGPGLDIERYESIPGRGSIVARIEGSDPQAESLCLMGHTDVVPVSPSGWDHDPFGGELIDGEVWGRGAIDMLNLTSSMAVAFRHLANTGFKPKGDLIFFGVADEEAGGKWGAEWMFDHHADAIDADYVLTELGGWSSVDNHGVRHVTVNIGEKGLAWRKLTVLGTPGHGSMPFGADNALVKTAEIVRRLSEYRPTPHIGEAWIAQVRSMGLPEDFTAALLDPDRVYDTVATLPVATARACHALTHTTISPNVAHGGVKTNVIPDKVELEVDIRTVPGTTRHDVDAMLADALGDLAAHVEISILQESLPTQSVTTSRLWDSLAANTQIAYPGSKLVPGLIVGATDARFYRYRGRVAYGAGLLSPNMDFATFGDRFHGHNERIDVESLALATDFWIGVARDILT